MTTPPAHTLDQLRQRAIQLAQQGRPAEARDLLLQLLAQSPTDEQALLWLAQISPRREEQIDALQRALALRPSNVQAQQQLAALRGVPASPPGWVAPEPLQQPASSQRQPGARTLTFLALCLLLLGLGAGALFTLRLLSLMVNPAATPYETVVGDSAREHVFTALLVATCAAGLIGGLGLLLRRRWGWGWALLLQGGVLVDTYLRMQRVIRTGASQDMEQTIFNYLLVLALQLWLIFFMLRPARDAQLGLTPRYRIGFAIVALLVGGGLAALPYAGIF